MQALDFCLKILQSYHIVRLTLGYGKKMEKREKERRPYIKDLGETETAAVFFNTHTCSEREPGHWFKCMLSQSQFTLHFQMKISKPKPPPLRC